MRYLILSILFLASCSTQNKLTEFERAVLRTNALTEKYGQIETPETRQYLNDLCQRIAYWNNIKNCEVTVVNTNKDLAFAAGAGKLLISVGLVSKINNEVELAFVLAHELSHMQLKHQDYQLENEFEADARALKIISNAGYNSGTALIIFNQLDPLDNDKNTQIMQKRQAKLLKMQRNLPNQGTVNTRDFRQFKTSFN